MFLGSIEAQSATKSSFFFFIYFPLTSSVVLLLISPPTEHQDWQGYSSSCTSSLHKIQLYNWVEAGNRHWLLWRKQHVFRAVDWHWTSLVVTEAILLTYYFSFVAIIFLLSMSFIFYINIGGYLKICCIFYKALGWVESLIELEGSWPLKSKFYSLVENCRDCPTSLYSRAGGPEGPRKFECMNKPTRSPTWLAMDNVSWFTRFCVKPTSKRWD